VAPVAQVVAPLRQVVLGLPQQELSDLHLYRQVFPAGPRCLWYLLLPQVVVEWSSLVVEWSSLVVEWSSAGPLWSFLPLRPRLCSPPMVAAGP
jgi:hypothetical protein